MKKYISLLLNLVNNIYKNRRHFVRFFLQKRSNLIRTLKKNGFTNIRPAEISQWKLQYNICYFSANYFNHTGQNCPVFIKIYGPTTKDCFNNEIVVNQYIKEHSPYLFERSPELMASLVVDDLYILAFAYVAISPLPTDAAALKEINLALAEFGKHGLIHTDFGLVNIGYVKESGKYCFFDYGTTLCPESDHIRVRNGKPYNHIGSMPDNINVPGTQVDFYYDDAVHLRLPGLISNGNYILGSGSEYCAKLGSRIYRYRAQRRQNSVVDILCWENTEDLG